MGSLIAPAALDYYAALGVPRDADAAEIRATYRRLAARLHPDRNPGLSDATARFKGVVEAYAILGDPERRAAYDAALPSGAPSPEAASGLAEFVGGLVDGLFGVQDRRPRPGRNRVYRLDVPFADAVLAHPQRLRVPTERTCEACEGRGFPLGAIPEVCPRCLGGGAIQGRPFLRSAQLPCPSCAGRGYRLPERCPACDGRGAVEREELLELPLPAGCCGGERLRVRGRGEPGRFGGADGDLLVEVEVAPHPRLRRDGDDVVTELPVTLFEALTGAVLTVPTVEGPREVRLPACSSEGTVLRLAGYGALRADGSRGHQRATIAVEWPDTLSDDARRALARLSADVGGAPFPRTTASRGQGDV